MDNQRFHLMKGNEIQEIAHPPKKEKAEIPLGVSRPWYTLFLGTRCS